MKGIIHRVDYERKKFYVKNKRKLSKYYLTSSLANLFLEHLSKGVLVAFVPGTRRRRGYQQVVSFIYIANLKTEQVVYDIYQLREDMKEVLLTFRNLLFIDFEMTMPQFGTNFRPELIQMGYVLTNQTGNIITKNNYYIKPRANSISLRTVKFLKLDEESFWESAKPYEKFYEELAKTIEAYNPQIIVWGKNDIVVLHDSYEMHKLPPLTTDEMFTDLLELHKNYYLLKDDLGLFKAYEIYFGKSITQTHDALDDAFKTSLVYGKFIEEITKNLKQ